MTIISIEEVVAAEYFLDFGEELGDGVVGGVRLSILDRKIRKKNMTENIPRFFNMPRRRDRIHSDKFFIFSAFRSSWGEELGKVANTFVCNLVCLVRRLQSIDVGTANAEETWSNTYGER